MDQCQRVTPTIVEQLNIQGYTHRNEDSLRLNDLKANAGSILIDTPKYHGDLVSLLMQPIDAYDNITSPAVTPSSASIRDNSGTHLLSSADLSVAAVLDSGTPVTEIPADVANAFNGIGAVNAQGQVLIPCRYHDADDTIIYGFGVSSTAAWNVPISKTTTTTTTAALTEQASGQVAPSYSGSVFAQPVRDIHEMYTTPGVNKVSTRVTITLEDSLKVVSKPYHTTHDGEATQLANFIFAASAAVQCESMSTKGPKAALAGLTFPVVV